MERRGWIGLEECAMGDAVDKLVQAIQDDGRFINGRKTRKD